MSTRELNPKRTWFHALLFVVSAYCSSCVDDAGHFRLELSWRDTEPGNASDLFAVAEVWALAVDMHEGEARLLAQTRPTRYADGVVLPFDAVPIGAKRQVRVKLYDPASPEQIVYYGLSEPFDMAAGEDRTVKVSLALAPAPGGSVTGSGISLVAAPDVAEPNLSATTRVTLRAVTDTAKSITLSNLPLGAEGGTMQQETLADHPTDDSVDLAPGLTAYLIESWDLDRGLPEAQACGESDNCQRKVYARFQDENGVDSPLYDLTITVDSKPPSLAPGTALDLTLIPSTNNPLQQEQLQAVGIGTRIRASFYLSERVTAASVRAVPEDGGDALDLTPLSAQASAVAVADQSLFVFEQEYRDVTQRDADTYRIRIEATDRAGNKATIEGDAQDKLIIDTVAPDDALAPDATSSAPPTLIYERAPWGTDTTESARFAVRAAPGSVEPHAFVQLLDGPDVTRAWKIGEARADDAGGFESTALTPPDRTAIYARVVDPAGNASPHASLVHDVEWRAGFRDVGRGNPHRFDSRAWYLPVLKQPRAQTFDTAELAGALAAADGSSIESRGAGSFASTSHAMPFDNLTGPTGVALDRARGELLIFDSEKGGYRWNGWDVATRGWENTLPAPFYYGLPAMTWYGDRGHALLFGGVDEAGYDKDQTMPCGSGTDAPDCAPTVAWDGNQQLQSVDEGTGTAPAIRAEGVMTFDEQRQRVVLMGGWASGPGCGSPLPAACRDTWEWDGTQWTKTASDTDIPVAAPGGPTVQQVTGAYDQAKARTVVFAAGQTWSYDGTWTQLADAPSSGVKPADGALRRGMTYSTRLQKLVLFTSNHSGAICKGEWADSCTVLWTFDDGSRQWQPLTAAPPSAETNMSWLAEDIFGNLLFMVHREWQNDIDPEGYTEAYVYDGQFWSRAASTDANFSFGPALGYDRASHVLASTGGFGGFDEKLAATTCPQAHEQGDEPPRASVDLWNGQGWLLPAPDLPAAQSPRVGAALTWSEAEHSLMLLGGRYGRSDCQGVSGPCCDGEAGAFCNAMWKWNGSTFARATRTLTPGPGPRSEAAVATVGNGLILVFGGYHEEGAMKTYRALDDTWIYSASGWSAAPSAAKPSPRLSAAIAYDPVHDAAVLFGGTTLDAAGGCSDLLADTWIWRDAKWQLHKPAHAPSARRGARIAYVPDRKSLLLYGGIGLGTDGTATALDDAWEWQGDDWHPVRLTDLEGDDNPDRRIDHALALDEQRGQVMLSGGGGRGSVSWLWRSGAQARPAQVITFDLSGASIPADAALRGIALAWTGSAHGDGSEEPRLEVWRNGRFWSAEDLGFERGADAWSSRPDSRSSELQRLRYHYDGGDAISFAVMPAAPSGTRPEYASISTDHAGLVLRYRQ